MNVLKKFLVSAGAAFLANAALISTASAAPQISELMASNGTTILDQDGYSADWLEIYNPDAVAVDLSGWYLTNSATNLGKWMFPAVSVAPGATLVVFCSSKNYTDPAAPLATNFNLPDSGGYVALVKPDKTTIVSSYTYPTQYPDISYGTSQPTGAGETAQTGYLISPTPGAVNGNSASVLLPERVTIGTAPGIFLNSTTVTLSGATGAQRIRYDLVASSSAGDDVPAPKSTSTLYTGPITISSTTLLRAAVFSADDTQRGLPSNAMYLKLDNSTANRLDNFLSTLPIVVVDDNGRGLLPKDNIFYTAWVGAFGLDARGTASLTQAPDFFTQDTMKNHGFSSSQFPKQSYEVQFTTDLGVNAPRSFFGLDVDRSWDLISPWSVDLTYLHNAFVYTLARGMGYWAPSTKFAQLFIHSGGGPLDYNSFAGLTIVTDRIKVAPRRVNIFSLSPSDVTAPNVTGGYILRFDHPEENSAYYTWTTRQGTTLSIDTPKMNVLVPAQRDYIVGYVQAMEDAMEADRNGGYATRNYLGYLDRPSWVDYHLLNVFTENDDAFQFSEYFTKDVNGLIKAGPVWDYDRAMNSADGRDVDPQRWTPVNEDHDYWDISWWTYVTHDPDFMQLWVDRWQTLRLSLLSNTNLTQLVDSLAVQIGQQAAALDSARWPANVSRYPGGWQGEVDHMKTWLTTRAQWIDSQFVAPPTVAAVNGSTVITPAPGTKVAYTLDGSDPRFPGGAVRRRAQTSGAPVVLASNQVYYARSYDASRVGAYPGSPWSSAVSYAGNTTGQLSNVSCRTQVGTGTNALVAGFVVAGPAGVPTQMLIRAVGPTLTDYGVTGTLAKPVLSVYDGNARLVAVNSGWGTSVNAALTQSTAQVVGAFALPLNSADSALLLSLQPGVYSAQVTGANSTTGNGLVEAYQVSQDALQVSNVSSRAQVSAATGPLIAGFVITQGPAQVLIRGIGPGLTTYGVTNALPTPTIQVFDSTGTQLATNSGWGNNSNTTQIAAAAATVGAFPLAAGSADSALLITLPPGAYSVYVTGATGTSGVALAECYVVPTGK